MCSSPLKIPWQRVMGRKAATVGKDTAERATTPQKLKLGEIRTMTPTIGFNAETVGYEHISFNVRDVGGHDKVPPLGRHYLQNSQGRTARTRDAVSPTTPTASATLGELQKMPNEDAIPDAISFDLLEPAGLAERHDGRPGDRQSGCAQAVLQGLRGLYVFICIAELAPAVRSSKYLRCVEATRLCFELAARPHFP